MCPDVHRLIVQPEQTAKRLAEREIGTVIGEDEFIVLEVSGQGMEVEEAVLVIGFGGNVGSLICGFGG